MSITFSAPQSPIKTYIERECLCVFDTPDPTCHYCKGTGIDKQPIYEVPELNMSNDNAKAILALIGLEDEYCGVIEVADIPQLRQRILAHINRPASRAPFTEESFDNKGIRMENKGNLNIVHRTCRIISPGRSDDYLVAKLRDFDTTLKEAQQRNLYVCWG